MPPIGLPHDGQTEAAGVNAANISGKTALSLARDPAIIGLLKEAGAK
jgi:hypothetical protein